MYLFLVSTYTILQFLKDYTWTWLFNCYQFASISAWRQRHCTIKWYMLDRKFHMKREKTNVRLYISADKTHKDSLKVATKQPFSVEKEALIFCSKTRTQDLIYIHSLFEQVLIFSLTSEPLHNHTTNSLVNKTKDKFSEQCQNTLTITRDMIFCWMAFYVSIA